MLAAVVSPLTLLDYHVISTGDRTGAGERTGGWDVAVTEVQLETGEGAGEGMGVSVRDVT